MTVSATPRIAGPYIGTGSVSTFPFGFKVLQASDVLVATGATGALQTTLTSGFSVSLNGNQDVAPGGSVTLSSPLALGQQLVIGSAAPLAQKVDLRNSGSFNADSIETALDNLEVQLQQLAAELAQSVRVPDLQGVLVLPQQAARANTVQGFDGTGQPIVMAAGDLSAPVTTPTEAGGTPELITVWIQRERIFPEQFLAVAGTTTSYTSQLQNAINAASLRGMPLNLRGRYYRSDLGLVIPVGGIEIENGHLDLSHVAGGAYGVTSGGALGLSVSITAPVARYATVLPLATTSGLAAGQAILVGSADFWASAAAVTKREWARIKSVDSGFQVTLTQPLRDAYSTTPVIYAPAIVDHVIMTNVHLHGGGNGLNQNGSLLQYVRDVRIFGADARTFASRGMAYDTCQSIEIDGGRPGEGDDATGLSYGHVISGATDSIKARAITGDGLRHVISAGGASGVVRGYRCDGIVGLAMTDATVDAHPAVDDAKFYDIDHTADNYGGGANGDGLVSQARHTLIDGFKILRAGRHAILVQPQCSTDKAVVEIGKGEVREHASYGGSTGWAINVDFSVAGAAGAARVKVEDVDAESAQTLANGILITTAVGAVDSGDIGGGRVKTPGRALVLDASTTVGQKITHLNVSGGYYERTNQSSECIYLAPAASGNIDFLKMRGFHAQGGTFGVRNLNGWTTNYHLSDFSCRGYLTGATQNITASGTTQFVTNANT